ncbi:MAG: hypothetical protein JSU82_01250 [Rhodospirillales bacterium]|nr:MAG: hypothetical protein JSU82_01250 [Rhodospirillales bacterium]
MAQIFRWSGQAIIYAAMGLWLGYFANQPVYVHLPPDQGLIKLSVVHGAQRKGACRKRTPEELAAMNPNMRTPYDCPRERLPVRIEILLDGEVLYDRSVAATGLAHGGSTRAYERFAVASGQHELVARMVDSARTEGFDFEHAATIDLAPGENFVIDFRAEAGGFLFEDGADSIETPG